MFARQRAEYHLGAKPFVIAGMRVALAKKPLVNGTALTIESATVLAAHGLILLIMSNRKPTMALEFAASATGV